MVHIGDKANSDFKVSIKIEKIGTSYFTVSANANSSNGAITEYIFVVDGIEKAPSTQNTYTEENLEKVSKHRVKVIAVDEKGNRKTSREVSLTTEDRTYIYDAGNEFTDITGGFVDAYGASNIEIVKTSEYMMTTGRYIYPNHGFISTNNAIKMDDYTKVKIIAEHNGNIEGRYFGMIRISRDKNSSYTDFLAGYGPGPDEPGIAKTEIEIDVKELTGDCYIRIGAYASGKYMKVYSIWLEK